MQILVTGGAGFMGSAFIRMLLEDLNFKGKVINLDLLTYAANLENLKTVDRDPRYHFYQGNISDRMLLEKIHGLHAIDTIVHFAAETHVDRSINSPSAFMETNVMGTFHLLEFVRKNPEIHFHHISTDEVYGELGSEGVFTETSPYKPSSPYSASKAASDHLVLSYHKTYDLSVTVSHSSNNYGPHQFKEKLIPLMIHNCFENKPLPVYGNGQNVRDWIYVDDHARAVKLILDHGKRGEVYNIGSSNEKKNLDLIHLLIAEVAKWKREPEENLKKLITFVKDRAGHDFRYAIDTSKIKREVGFKPQVSFEEGIKKTIEVNYATR